MVSSKESEVTLYGSPHLGQFKGGGARMFPYERRYSRESILFIFLYFGHLYR